MFIVATGPTELHAHIDLDKRVHDIAPASRPHVQVLATSQVDGQWSIVAEVRPRKAGE